jgi:hypothetical protein
MKKLKFIAGMIVLCLIMSVPAAAEVIGTARLNLTG